MTALQAYLQGLADLVLDARDELDDEQYVAFIWIATDRIGLEAARLAVGEGIRATRVEDAA